MTVQGISSMSLFEEFKACQDFQRLEELADALGDSGDKKAIEALLYRLGDERVQEDRDVEDAFCGHLRSSAS